jgi:integrase
MCSGPAPSRVSSDPFIIGEKDHIVPSHSFDTEILHGFSNTRRITANVRKVHCSAHSGIPDRDRGRAAAGRGSEEGVLGSPRRDHDSDRVPACLRASEVRALQCHQVELQTGRLHVRRNKGGTPRVHTLQSDESVPFVGYRWSSRRRRSHRQRASSNLSSRVVATWTTFWLHHDRTS